ncbi:Ubiquitin-conjugating enzyme E2 1 [Blastocladiella emersonii ATCC 22665]|nr:Ubiquitin-conjugating enzyme E2 1 [Blastocladiella emersonii ATCC 22665]
MATRRLQKEIQEAARAAANDGSRIAITVLDAADLTNLRGTICGPAGTPYEGGTFDLSIKIPANYPFAPPEVKFITRVYHPNVSSQSGAICLDILKNEWTPVLNLSTTLLSVQQLLESPEPDDPQDAMVAGHYRRDRADFDATARQWTECYAMPGGSSKTPKPAEPSAASAPKPREESIEEIAARMSVNAGAMRRLCEMGFAPSRVGRALLAARGREADAVEALLTGSD